MPGIEYGACTVRARRVHGACTVRARVCARCGYGGVHGTVRARQWPYPFSRTCSRDTVSPLPSNMRSTCGKVRSGVQHARRCVRSAQCVYAVSARPRARRRCVAGACGSAAGMHAWFRAVHTGCRHSTGSRGNTHSSSTCTGGCREGQCPSCREEIRRGMRARARVGRRSRRGRICGRG